MRSAFPGPPQIKNTMRPPSVPSFPAMPTGPRDFAQRNKPILPEGPGMPPDNFVRATTSGDEWRVFWAFRRVMEPDVDPRQPNYDGQFTGSIDPELFSYQYFYDQGRRELGGTVVDFVAYPFQGDDSILVRLQTEAWHVFSNAKKQAYDQLQARWIGRYGRVYDIFSQWIMVDDTGVAAIMAIKDCLSGNMEPNPLLTGQAQRLHL